MAHRLLQVVSAALAACLLAPPSVHAQAARDLRMQVTLGTPPELDLDVRYFDPSDLFLAVRDSRVLPFWVTARNVSGRQLALEYGDFQIGLGNPGGIVKLQPLDPAAAAEELRRATSLPRFLRALTGQGGEFAADPMRRSFRGGTVAPGREASGWIFFLRPDDVAFTGVLELGTSRHPNELLSTGSVRVSDPRETTRSSLQERVIDAINDAIAFGEQIVFGQRPFDRSYAVLFGVSEYDYRSDLSGPARDLENLSKALRDQGFDKVVLVANRDVTADTLRNIRQHFSEAGRLQPNDRLLVYYSGHGERDPAGDTGYIVLSASGAPGRSRRTEVSMTEFMSWMKALPVKHLLVILDACYSGLAIGGISRGDGPPLDATNRQALYQISSRSGRFVITAGDETQRAHEHARWDGGLLTRGILHALQTRDIGRPHNRLVTTFELYARAKQFVGEQVRRYRLTPQTPLIRDLGEAPSAAGGRPSPVSRGEFVFVNVS